MSYRYLLITLGIIMMVLGLTERSWFLIVAWLGANFSVLGTAHARNAPGVFGKRMDGTLPWWSWVLFLPMHCLTMAVWHLARMLGREQAYNEVTGNLVVGRRLQASEMNGDFDNYVDLTAEFTEPSKARCSGAYLCFPILDGAAPTPEALRNAVARIRPGRTFVHCAQGHGRTGLFALAALLHTGAAQSVEHGLHLLSKARPGIRLNKAQLECVQAFVRLTH